MSETQDRLRLRGLRVFARHGALAHEAQYPQLFVVDVEAALDLRAAGERDDLAQTIDYGVLAARIQATAVTPRRALIEALAGAVAETVLQEELVRWVRVIVTKPHAPVGVDVEVSVELVRHRVVA